MSWLERNYKLLIRIAYVIPIFFAVYVSISHVIIWYEITNPIAWAIYLSVGIEIAALSALAGLTIKINKFVYVPFFIVTFIQFVGNVFYSFQYIDVNGVLFKSWLEFMSVTGWFKPTDIIDQKFFLALISGGFIAIISLSFLHLLIRFNEDEFKKKEIQGKDNSIEENDIAKESAIVNNSEIKIEEDLSDKDIAEDTTNKNDALLDIQEATLNDQYEENNTEIANIYKEDSEGVNEGINEGINEGVSEEIKAEVTDVAKEDVKTEKPIEAHPVKTIPLKIDKMNISRIGTNKLFDNDDNKIIYKK